MRHLALIEIVEKTFTELPHDHDTLLREIATHREAEKVQCQVLSEMEEEAVLRLVAYSKVEDNNFANARFLDLKEAMSELDVKTSLKKIVGDLRAALDKQCIDMSVFKPNQFAALSVYYAKFVTQATI